MTKYIKYIFAFAFICNSCFADEIDSGWNNFKNSLLNDLNGMDTSFGVVSDTYYNIDNKLGIIINQANNLPSDYSSLKNTIINSANSAKQSLSLSYGAINTLRQDVSSMQGTVSYMYYPSSSLGSSSSDPSITNDLQSIISHLSRIEEYDGWTVSKIQELIQTNRPIRDNISNLLYRVEHNIISSMGTIQAYTVSIASTASSILTQLSAIQTYLDSANTYLLHIRNNSNILVNELRAFVTSWNNHADHQDEFYDNCILLLRKLGGTLNQFATNSNFHIDFSNLSGLITNVNLTSYIGIKEFYQSLSDSILTYPYPKTSYGRPNGQLGFSTSSISALGSILPQILSSDGSYNPFLLSVWLQSVLAVNTSTLNSWQYLLNTNLVDLVQSSGVISGFLRDIDSSTRGISVAISTNNFILGQQLAKLEYLQSLFSNNVPVASLNLDRNQVHSTWYDFFTNFYLNVSLGWDESGSTPQYSSWQSNTNWFNRIEALLAALVFQEDKSGKVTNVVSSSETSSAVQQAVTTLEGAVTIDNSYSADFTQSTTVLIDMLRAWTTEINTAAEVGEFFDLFTLPHMDSSESSPANGSKFSLDGDMISKGDWAFRINAKSGSFADFLDFVRALSTVLWIVLFMFFGLKMSIILIIFICKYVYFCYCLFSAMMGGD